MNAPEGYYLLAGLVMVAVFATYFWFQQRKR